MKIKDLRENISVQQRRAGQLPADFRPPKTSPQLSGPYPGRNATRGYLVGESDQESLAELAGDEMQYATTTAPTATDNPERLFGVLIYGRFGQQDPWARTAWAALRRELPREYPSEEDAQIKVAEISKHGGAIVTEKSKPEAERLVKRFQSYGLKSKIVDPKDLTEIAGKGQDPSQNPMAQAVTRRIMNQHPEWLERYGVETVMQMIDDVTAGEEDWEEIGSSDVSAFVNMVGDRLTDWTGSREEMRDRRPFAEQDSAHPQDDMQVFEYYRVRTPYGQEYVGQLIARYPKTGIELRLPDGHRKWISRGYIQSVEWLDWKDPVLRDKKDVSEMDSQGYRGHRGDEDPGKGPEKLVQPAKAKDVAKDAAKKLTKAMDRAHKKPDVEEGTDFFDRFGHDTMPKDKKKSRPRLGDIKVRMPGRSPDTKSPKDKKPGVEEGFMDTIKGAAKEFTRDSLQRKIKQAWEQTFWPQHIEPALNRIQINGRPFRKMVLGEPRMIENDRSQRALLKQYTVNIVFPIDPRDWAGDEIKYLEGQLQDIQDGAWNPKVHGLGLVSFDQPMKSFQYTRGETPDLVIPVRITSLDINRGLVSEQGVAEAGYNPLDDERREQQRMDQERAQFKRDELAAELSGEEQRYRDIMSGTWYVIIDGRAWQRQGQPVTFRGREAARRAGQTIKNRNPQKTVTITMQLPAADSDLREAPLDLDLIQRAQGGMAGTNTDSDSNRFGDQPYGYRDRTKSTFDPMARLDKGAVNRIEKAMGIRWPKTTGWQPKVQVDEQDYLEAFRAIVAEGVTSEDVLSTMKRRLGDYLQDVAAAIRKDPDLIDKIPKDTDQIGPAVRTIRTADGHEIKIHGNEDDGFRISIKNQRIPSSFKTLGEAEMATEMYCARRRAGQQLRDDYIDEA
jgi:hypothetical protein